MFVRPMASVVLPDSMVVFGAIWAFPVKIVTQRDLVNTFAMKLSFLGSVVDNWRANEKILGDNGDVVFKKNDENTMDSEENKWRSLNRSTNRKTINDQNTKKTSKICWSCHKKKPTGTFGNNRKIWWKERQRKTKRKDVGQPGGLDEHWKTIRDDQRDEL